MSNDTAKMTLEQVRMILDAAVSERVGIAPNTTKMLADALADLATRVKVTEVFVCSNPKCSAVYAKDPMGHCPTCIQPSGVGFSTMRKDVK